MMGRYGKELVKIPPFHESRMRLLCGCDIVVSSGYGVISEEETEKTKTHLYPKAGFTMVAGVVYIIDSMVGICFTLYPKKNRRHNWSGGEISVTAS